MIFPKILAQRIGFMGDRSFRHLGLQSSPNPRISKLWSQGEFPEGRMSKISSLWLHFPIFTAWNSDPGSSKYPGNMSSQSETFPEDWNRAGLNPPPIPTALFWSPGVASQTL